MTDGLGSIASAFAGRAADGRYRRRSGGRLNAVDASPWLGNDPLSLVATSFYCVCQGARQRLCSETSSPKSSALARTRSNSACTSPYPRRAGLFILWRSSDLVLGGIRAGFARQSSCRHRARHAAGEPIERIWLRRSPRGGHHATQSRLQLRGRGHAHRRGP